MPGTASAASSAAAARATSASVVGSLGSSRSSATGFGRRGGVGQAGVGILGHHPRHRHGALGQLLEAGGIHRAGRDDGGPLAQEHPQPEVAAFRALDVLGLAQPALHRQRGAGDQHRIRRIGPGGAGAGDQVGEEVQGLGHRTSTVCKAGARTAIGRIRGRDRRRTDRAIAIGTRAAAVQQRWQCTWHAGSAASPTSPAPVRRPASPRSPPAPAPARPGPSPPASASPGTGARRRGTHRPWSPR